MSAKYRKHFLPLESNPEVFNELLQLLGVPEEIAFEDVFTLDEPDFLPRPALAVVLVFPTTGGYDARLAASESSRPEYTGRGAGEPVLWFKQTINNACGLYAIMHALGNSKAQSFIKPDSLLFRLFQDCVPREPSERAKVLEDSAELESAYATVATKGDSAVPESPEAEVYFHYICFARSDLNGHIYDLNGDCKGPVDTGVVIGAEADLLGPEALEVIKKYIDREGGNIQFNLMALVHHES
ncbi:ubiquitin carboxyl-terminal hydrolase, family 1 [Podospora appendiculata]|uniref:Ubiquitin carboxyl-terminal hydrolase n=1 Tax=Podospora appendiculata TaxID=314037 RepID=A0AAE1C7W3_9PEZI|nr:ubiquitin carboxyl-terminal hydrolase, family 1 [Podospora appendiculata]